MKFNIAILLVVLALMAFVVPMFLKGPGGKPILTPEKLLPVDEVKQAARQVKELLYKAGEVSEEKAGVRVGLERPKFYRWQDEQGNWHYSDTAPEGISVDSERLPDAQNVVEFPDPPATDSGVVPAPLEAVVEQFTEMQSKTP